MFETTSGTAGFAFVKAYGFKAAIGMVGAALLYVVLPPENKDGTFNKKEFVSRLSAAGVFSHMFGDWAVDILSNVSWLYATNHKAAIYLIVGAPAWWISRAVALWFQNRRAKDVGELIRDAKDVAK